MTTTPTHGHAVRRSGSRFDFGTIAEAYDRWYGTRAGRTYDALEMRAVERLLPRPAPGPACPTWAAGPAIGARSSAPAVSG